MTSIIHFNCRMCDGSVVMVPAKVDRVACPHCNHEMEVALDMHLLNGGRVTTCVACGHDTFYIQKDFNRRLGLAIVGIGIAISVYFFSQNEAIYAMAALAATAVVDFLAYLGVGEVTVCYSCHAIYRGFERNPEHEPFDLKRLEKYGGRTPRLP